MRVKGKLIGLKVEFFAFYIQISMVKNNQTVFKAHFGIDHADDSMIHIITGNIEDATFLY